MKFILRLYIHRDESNVIKTKDVQDAVYASSFVYDDEKCVVGNKVPNTNFKITDVYHDTITDGGEGFRVFLAEDGMTTMVSYRGTDG